ncbi:hypothetical protein SSX86_001289 [Deinandra increscens subsp. villosa]|uniref:Uncharacterized protein n=1 Tax=Deinandra increscens subsp. villosa TaxID=3103831 RepID=A0AAP0DR20_9ASTR
MAAETIAIELVNVLFQKLADEAFKRISRSQGIHKELKELGSTLSRIQDLLNDASQKEVNDKSVKNWLNGLQHLAYDIDDLLDDMATEAMHRELTPESGSTTSKSMTRENIELKDLNQLQMALTQQFKDKRFLLVVDDVWNESYDDWENLVRPFHSGAPGSRIIMTTRKEHLLIKLGFGHLDHLRSLSAEGALSLFALHALGVDNFDSHITLKPYGEELPKSFLKLKKLRHFDIRNTPLLEKLPLGIVELKNLQTLTRVIIEGGDGFAITELKDLKKLHGKVSIEGLHKVQNAMHARVADLSTKKITELELKWVDLFDGSRMGTLEKEVLDELKPNSARLKKLAIVLYGGVEYSNWVGDPTFHQLVKVSIHDCRKCTSLPPLGQLCSLKELSVRGMDEVKSIGLELAGSAVDAFASLETLSFEYMWGWEVWSTKNKVMFPCLQKLQIKHCPNLVNISLKALPSLRVLEITECGGGGVLRSVVETASLITHLDIRSLWGLTDTEWRGVMGCLRTVEEVTISQCNEIRYLWESETEASKFLVNLKKLTIMQCDNLVSLGHKKEDDNFGSNLLSSLMTLSVSHCESMKHVWCPNSNSIENLEIFSCDNMERVFFPATTGGRGGGQKLKSLFIYGCSVEKFNTTSMRMLESVYISGYRNLKSINELSNFIHITELCLYSCSSMESFPDLQLSNLTSLKSLHIVKCPSIDASFPRGLWPPKLASLRIGALKKSILEWGHQNFPTSLVDLALYGESDVGNFRALSHLLPLSLTALRIYEFDEVESLSLGLQHLTSLEHLEIWKCPKMKHLPETLLPSLLSLRICECQSLKERCDGRASHYWPLISHIPRIEITDWSKDASPS